MSAINIILARSPYQVVINESSQIKTKVELRLWNKGGSRPTSPTYIMSEGIASVTQIETNYNISPFVLEFIDKYKLQYSTTGVIQAGDKEWCIGEYARYYTINGIEWIKLDETSFCAVNGFSEVQRGYNFNTAQGNPYKLLANPEIKVLWSDAIPYYNFICKDRDDSYTADWYDKSNGLVYTETFYTGVNDFFNYAIPLVISISVKLVIKSNNYGVIYTIYTEEICEPTYPINRIWFVNNYGGWNHFAFFKASYNSIDIKNSDYSLMQRDIDYDFRRGQTKPFNINGTQTLKLNTGWVEENIFEWVQNMMLSDTVVYELNQIPVTVKTTSMQKKIYLKDKNINYTIEFDFANKLLNNIV